MDSKDGMLSLILLCDQYARSAFRKTKKAFDFDEIALKIAKKIISSG
jgi:uncharacterized protein (DUF924 family)